MDNTEQKIKDLESLNQELWKEQHRLKRYYDEATEVIEDLNNKLKKAEKYIIKLENFIEGLRIKLNEEIS